MASKWLAAFRDEQVDSPCAVSANSANSPPIGTNGTIGTVRTSQEQASGPGPIGTIGTIGTNGTGRHGENNLAAAYAEQARCAAIAYAEWLASEDPDLLEETAAIMEFDGGLSREEAERRALADLSRYK